MSENDTTLEDRFGPMPDCPMDQSAYQNELAFRRQYDETMAQYQRGWVAMLDCRVIAHDADYENLHKRLHESHPSQGVYLRRLEEPKAFREPKRVGGPRRVHPRTQGILEKLLYVVRNVFP